MFEYITVNFPESTIPPQLVYTFSLFQNRYQHEIAILTFRDWNVQYDAVTTNSPVTIKISDGKNKRLFKGYVFDVIPRRTPNEHVTDVWVISPSFFMKNASQKIHKNMSADAVIKQIAGKHRFNAFCTPHPRIYPQVSQAGHTDWELMVKLAKQCGYSLRTENTEIYLQPVLQDYTMKRSGAPRFIMREANNPNGSTIYNFYPDISESISYDGDLKAAVAVSGLDSKNKAPVSITQQLRKPKTKKKSKPEIFNKFDTHIVATDALIAKYEAEAAEQRVSFPYRATATVLGDASLRPDLPVYLDGVQEYSGYWVILGTEHIIEEQQRNFYMYTTKLYLGTDSLGQAERWEDGQQVVSPTDAAIRTIIPGVRQINTPPESTLLRTTPLVSPQNSGYASEVTNRVSPEENSRYINSAKWVATSPAPALATTPKPTEELFANRILSKVSSIL